MAGRAEKYKLKTKTKLRQIIIKPSLESNLRDLAVRDAVFIINGKNGIRWVARFGFAVSHRGRERLGEESDSFVNTSDTGVWLR